MRKTHIPAWLKAAIEDELRDYPLTKIALRERKREIFESTSPYEFVGTRSTGKADPTFAKASRLCSADIMRMEWFCRAIEDVYGLLGQEQKKIVQLYYWNRWRHYEVADCLGVSESTLWRLRQEIIRLIAHRMGMIRPRWYKKVFLSRDKSERILKENAARIVVS